MKLMKRFFSTVLATIMVFSVFSYELGTVQALNATANATTIAYTINFYLQGTTTKLITSVTGTGDDGTYVNAEAQEIQGYLLTPFDASPVRFLLSSTNNTVNFYYIAKNYTIVFDSRGGTAINPITQGYNTSILKPTNPIQGNYSFTGWYTEAACTHLVSWPYKMPLNGGTLYAGWSQTPFTLTFVTNNSYTIKATAGTLVQQPTDPTRTYFRFDGWYLDSACSQAVNWPLTMPMNNLSVYAKWVYTLNTITFNSNGGTAVNQIRDNLDAEIDAPDVPQREGYTFAGWYYDNGTFQNAVVWPIIMPEVGFTLYAKWTPNKITITFDSDGGTAVNPLIADTGSAITAPAAPRKFGYVFSGWVLNDEYHDHVAFTFSTMPTVNFTLYATWSATTKAVKADLQTFKTVNGLTIPATKARAGDIVTVRLTPKTNFFCGSTNYVIMYDSSFYTIVGNNNEAITPNTENTYYKQSISSYRGYTASPSYQWPGTFTNGESSRYKFVTASFAATGQSLNKGLPTVIEGSTWLFSINLRVNANATGSGNVFMDTRWDRSSTNTTGAEYYYYCTSGTVLSSTGNSTIDFITDYTGANCDVAFDSSIPVTSYIFFDSDGGSEVPVFTGEVGTPIAEPTPPTKLGYTFDKWTPDFPSTVPANDLKLIAKWKVNTYNAFFYDENNNLLATVPTKYGEQIIAPDPSVAPAKTGCTATGWTPTPDKMEAHDMSFVVVYTTNEYTVTFIVNGRETKVKGKYGDPLIPPTDLYKEGYTFSAWSPPPPATIPASNTKVFTAIFTINQYTITFDSQGGSYVAPKKQNYNTSVLKPTDPTRPFYTFGGWYYEQECITPVAWPYKVEAKDVIFYAKWTRVPVSFITKAGSTILIDQSKYLIYGLEEGILTSESNISDFFTVTGDGRLEILTAANNGYGSGAQVQLIDNVTNGVLETYSIVIFGDVDGDGYVTSADVDQINMAASYQTAFDEGSPSLYAADINHDGIIDAFDLNIARAKVSNVGSIDQTNGGQSI